jgi:hypothetical protein
LFTGVCGADSASTRMTGSHRRISYPSRERDDDRLAFAERGEGRHRVGGLSLRQTLRQTRTLVNVRRFDGK